MSAKTAKNLKQLADEKGISLTEVVRRAITVYESIENEVKDGKILLIHDPITGKDRELKFLL